LWGEHHRMAANDDEVTAFRQFAISPEQLTRFTQRLD
jgi:hypothetical protein